MDTWRDHYSGEHLEAIDLYNDICVPAGWWPVDRFSPELDDALAIIIAGYRSDEIPEMLREAVLERNRGDSVYNSPRGNKLIRILWNSY